MKIHKQYKILFMAIGCPDEKTFHRAAVHALERTLRILLQESADIENDPYCNDSIIALRADLAKLKLAVMDENEQAQYADKFMTI